MKTEPMQKEDRLEGTVKAVVTENGKVKYAYIAAGKIEYPVTEGSVQRMEDADKVLIKGNKVTFTVYHGKRDYANDVRLAPPKVKTKKPKMTDISMLSPETQEFVEFCMKERGFNIQGSILTTLFQPPYVLLSKEEYIAKYLEHLSGKFELRGIAVDERLVIELIDHYWANKKQN